MKCPAMTTFTVLRFAGPVMAWPLPSKHLQRFTDKGPTYSALIGILAAAAGVPRSAPLPSFLTDAKLASRLDRPGKLMVDFHTVNPRDLRSYHFLSDKDREAIRNVVAKADGTAHMHPVLTQRHYRSDQTVIVFVEDPQRQIAEVVTEPRWAFYAGRKSCVFDFPVLLGSFQAASIEDAVAAVPTVVPELPAGSTRQLEAIFYQPPSTPEGFREDMAHDGVLGAVGAGWEFRSRFRCHVKVQTVLTLPDLIAECFYAGEVTS